MRRESLLAVLGLLLGGAAGTYWLSGRALRPVRRVSEAAQHISLESLDVRLAVDGPDDELKRLADAFDAMLDRLRAGVERERLFLSAASHELRTPLAIVRTNLEVALANPDSTVDSYRRMAERAERSLSRLERVAEDLLTLARADVSLESEEVDIAGVVQEVAAELRPVAEENGIVLETEAAEGLQVRGEPALLYRALSNLVENGIRYNRSGGVVRVRAHQDREQVTLVVEDTGVGIPFDDQPSVFEPFFRVDRSRQRHRGGAGLGLALVREIVLWHGGTLTLKSSPGGGSMFTTRLPSAPTPR